MIIMLWFLCIDTKPEMSHIRSKALVFYGWALCCQETCFVYFSLWFLDLCALVLFSMRITNRTSDLYVTIRCSFGLFSSHLHIFFWYLRFSININFKILLRSDENWYTYRVTYNSIHWNDIIFILRASIIDW